MQIRHEKTEGDRIKLDMSFAPTYNDFHWHDFYEIVVDVSSPLKFYAAGNILSLNRGDIVLIEPYVLHSIMRTGDKSAAVTVIGFSGEQLSHLSPDFPPSLTKGSGVSVVTAPYDGCNVTTEISRQIFITETIDPKIADAMLRGYAAMLTGIIRCKGVAAAGEEHSAGAGSRIRTICSLIEDHPDGKYSAASMAAAAHYSTSYFSAEFKKAVGCTFKEYVDCVKIKEAQHLMCSLGLSATETAYRLNYSNPNNFSRSYRRITGKSPREYMRGSDE